MSEFEDLARDVTVLILGGGRGTRLAPLTDRRSKPAVPIAGKYRLIDIPISNAINSSMERMFVLTQFNSVSLHRHITRTYRFDAFSRGSVTILAAQQTPAGTSWFQGTADAVRQNINIIREGRSSHILILAGDHMYRMDYRQLLWDHIEHDADITIGVMPCSEDEIRGFGAARVSPDGQVLEFREKPSTAEAREGMEVSPSLLKAKGVNADQPYLASMGIYLFKREALLEALDNDLTDFGGDIIPKEVPRRKIQAHFYKGYWRDIGTIRAFFEAHMDLIRNPAPFSFHDPAWPFYTRPRFLPGALLQDCRFDRALLGDGSRVEGSNITDSVIGIRSLVRGANLDHVLMMGADSHFPDPGPGAPPVGIGPGSIVKNAIIDKNARIGSGVRIVNESGMKEGEFGRCCIQDGIVVVPKNAVIPDGTVI